MSAELYRARLAHRRQEILIARMRDAIMELGELADSYAISSPGYLYAEPRIRDLCAVGQLTTADIAAEFGPKPPDFDPYCEVP